VQWQSAKPFYRKRREGRKGRRVDLWKQIKGRKKRKLSRDLATFLAIFESGAVRVIKKIRPGIAMPGLCN
jgi:hypothetical protein